MKITAEDLKSFGICDVIIEEPQDGAQQNIQFTAKNIEAFITAGMRRFSGMDIPTLLEKRYQKFRTIGVYFEP
jgi:acetyl-CoA carboxylase carboxyl transferase subunit alpha